MAANKDTNIDNGSGEAAEVPAALDDSSEHQNEAEKSVTFSTPAPHPRPTLERQARSMRHIDIATGMMTKRKQSVMQIDQTATQPRSRLEKWMFWKKPQETTTPSGRHVVQGTGVRQFRIRSHQEGETWAEHVATASLLSEYLRWTFRASYTEVMLASFCFFMMITIIFAAFVYLIGQNQPQCISAGDANFAEAGTDFSDAYHLSWTTLSTVGYGVVGPTVGGERDLHCVGINFLMAFESFVGVIYGGVTGAIIFSKVARVQSTAQVLFSHPICVRYGTGVMQSKKDNDDEDDDTDGSATEDAPLELPLPILEFRMVNELANQKGGEIMNATVNIVATTLDEIDEADKVISNRRSMQRSGSGSKHNPLAKSVASATKGVGKRVSGATKTVKSTGAALLGTSKHVSRATGSIIQKVHYSLTHTPREIPGSEQGEVSEPFSSKELEKELEKEFAERFAEKLATDGPLEIRQAARTSVAVDEGNGQLAPRRIFHKLEVETDSHPFFKRVWYIRHVLNQNSPLLSADAKKMIANNSGFWPEELNDYASVREHINFHEIIVSFSGTANVSGSSVYAQKVYDYVDMNVGYNFAKLLGMSNEGVLTVDLALLNDVHEQNGGGGEPFTDVSNESEFALDVALQGATRTAETAAQTAWHVAGDVGNVAVRTGETIGAVTLMSGSTKEAPDKLEVEVDPEAGGTQMDLKKDG